MGSDASRPDFIASNELTKQLISKNLSRSEVTFMNARKSLKAMAGSLFAVGLLSVALVAETSTAARYDNHIQNLVTHKMASKNQFSNVTASVEDGIVTLTGTVDLY